MTYKSVRDKYKDIDRLRLEAEASDKARRMVMAQLKKYKLDDGLVDGKTLKWSKSLANHICDEIIIELKDNHQLSVSGIERIDFWIKVKEAIKSV